MHDMNLVVLVGRIAAPPTLKATTSGSRVVRYLVTSRVDEPRRRVDVIPVHYWMIDETEEAWLPGRGDPIMVIGQVQRRFWEASDGERRQRIEIIAEEVSPVDPERAPARLLDVSRRVANGGEEE